MPTLQRMIGVSIAMLLGGIIISAIARVAQFTIGATVARRGMPAGAAPGRRRASAGARPAPTAAVREMKKRQPRRRVSEKAKREVPSAQRLTHSMVNANRAIDELYGDKPNRKIAKTRIVGAISKASVDPDVSTFFDLIPDGSYRKQELIDALNTQVRRRRRVRAIGLFGEVPAEEEAQRQLQRKVA